MCPWYVSIETERFSLTQSLHESNAHARSIETRKHSDQEESGG